MKTNIQKDKALSGEKMTQSPEATSSSDNQVQINQTVAETLLASDTPRTIDITNRLSRLGLSPKEFKKMISMTTEMLREFRKNEEIKYTPAYEKLKKFRNDEGKIIPELSEILSNMELSCKETIHWAMMHLKNNFSWNIKVYEVLQDEQRTLDLKLLLLWIHKRNIQAWIQPFQLWKQENSNLPLQAIREIKDFFWTTILDSRNIYEQLADRWYLWTNDEIVELKEKIRKLQNSIDWLSGYWITHALLLFFNSTMFVTNIGSHKGIGLFSLIAVICNSYMLFSDLDIWKKIDIADNKSKLKKLEDRDRKIKAIKNAQYAWEGPEYKQIDTLDNKEIDEIYNELPRINEEEAEEKIQFMLETLKDQWYSKEEIKKTKKFLMQKIKDQQIAKYPAILKAQKLDEWEMKQLSDHTAESLWLERSDKQTLSHMIQMMQDWIEENEWLDLDENPSWKKKKKKKEKIKETLRDDNEYEKLF